MSINSIVTVLEKDGVRTRDGVEWRYSKVREMLVHPGYKGRHRIGIPMPVIIDENKWQKAQKRRENARNVLADPKGWLLQGICSCGECGHVLKCIKKKPSENRYYACRGRVSRNSKDEKHCKLPYVRADWLEYGVWEKVKEVLNDSGKLVESINKSLIELEKRRGEIGAESTAVESKLELIRTKEERLGMAFADGAVSETAYRIKLKRLKNEEADLLKCQRNIDPRELGEIASLGISIDMVKDVLSRGQHDLSDYDILGQVNDIMNNLDSNISSVKYTEKDPDDIKTTNLTVDTPTDCSNGDDLQENLEATLRNQRALLQKFNIRVVVYPDRVEIKGAIPTQILDNTEKQKTARIICSPCQGKGVKLREGLVRFFPDCR
jgi:hypothetical protein